MSAIEYSPTPTASPNLLVLGIYLFTKPQLKKKKKKLNEKLNPWSKKRDTYSYAKINMKNFQNDHVHPS